MKILLGKQIEEVKKKDSELRKSLIKNRNSDELNELDELDDDDVYFHSNAVKNIKLGTKLVSRIYLNNTIVYDLEDTIDLNLFHSLVPKATATSIIFDKLENQDVSGYNLVGYCDANKHIAVYKNSTEYLLLNIRNAVNYVSNCSSFFANYKSLISCVFNNFNTQNVQFMNNMFYNCSNLTSLDFSNFNTQNVQFMNNMFYNCSNLTSIDLSSFNTQRVTLMADMFYNCSNLTSIDLSRFNTQLVLSMQDMFYNCSNLTSIDLSSFNTQRVEKMQGMFYLCKNLTYIISNTFNTNSLAFSYDMFRNCNSLVGGNGTTYDVNYITAEYARVDGENGLPGYFTAPAVNNNK